MREPPDWIILDSPGCGPGEPCEFPPPCEDSDERFLHEPSEDWLLRQPPDDAETRPTPCCSQASCRPDDGLSGHQFESPLPCEDLEDRLYGEPDDRSLSCEPEDDYSLSNEPCDRKTADRSLKGGPDDSPPTRGHLDPFLRCDASDPRRWDCFPHGLWKDEPPDDPTRDDPLRRWCTRRAQREEFLVWRSCRTEFAMRSV